MIIGIQGKAGSGKDTIADILVRDHGFVKVALADPLKRICRDIYDFTDEQLWGPSEKRNEPDFRYLHRKAGAHGMQDVSTLISEQDRKRGIVTIGTFDDYPSYKDMEHLVTWYGDEDNFGFLPTPPEDEFLTPRYALQKLGTEWGRDCYAPTWIEYGLRVAKRILSEGTPFSYTARLGLQPNYTFGAPKPAGVVISDVRFLNEVEGLRAGGARIVRVKRPGAGLKGLAGSHRSETEQDNIPDDLFDFVVNNEGSLEDLIVLTEGFLSKFQIEQRDDGFAKMLTGIDHGAGPDETVASVHNVTDDGAINATVSLRLRDISNILIPEEEVSVPLGPPQVDGVDIIPANETPAQEHLRGMLQDRQRDVEAGKIIDYDVEQKDVAPFKRKKNP